MSTLLSDSLKNSPDGERAMAASRHAILEFIRYFVASGGALGVGADRRVGSRAMGERTSYLPGTFSWSELATSDAEAAASAVGNPSR